MKWDWQYVGDIMPSLLQGLGVTVQATLMASALALFVGLLFAVLRRSKVKAISYPTAAIVELIRRTPLIIQLYFIFYVAPLYGLTLPALAAGVIALGLQYSSYASEIYRAGIEGVPRGQWEAAQALSVPRLQTWTTVILPQAARATLPTQANIVIAMFKDSALLSAITVLELLAQARYAGTMTYQYLEPMTIVGLLYLIVSYTSGRLVKGMERRLAIKQ